MGTVVWITGRSGAGKTTLAERITKYSGAVLLDGDEIRAELSNDLGHCTEDRIENHRRIAAIASLLRSQGVDVVCATMAPCDVTREIVTNTADEVIHLDVSYEICKHRDPKGLYSSGTITEEDYK